MACAAIVAIAVGVVTIRRAGRADDMDADADTENGPPRRRFDDRLGSFPQ
jgi:hypothetical protein